MTSSLDYSLTALPLNGLSKMAISTFRTLPTVITLPDAPAIYLTHQPHAQVRWRTAGRKGLTMPLTEARQRLAMVLGR